MTRDPHQRRRRGRPQRRTKRTILLVTNGKHTERTYLTELKHRAKLSDAVVTGPKFVNGEPDTVVRNLQSPNGDTSDYDEVWIVVDEDQHDRREFLRTCAAEKGWHAIVSRPCFEVWLVAHYEPVHRYVDQADVQKHYRKLVPAGTPEKAIPAAFPYDQVADAMNRCHLPGAEQGGIDELPPTPGTGMPHLVKALGLVE